MVAYDEGATISAEPMVASLEQNEDEKDEDVDEEQDEDEDR
jgi:hypothetical protein